MNTINQCKNNTFAASQYAASNSNTTGCGQLPQNGLSAMQEYCLSGNVDLSNLAAYNFNDSSYAYVPYDPYANQYPDTLETWEAYFADMLNAIRENVSRRSGKATPLDFADIMMLIASLSSLVSLKANDLIILPDVLQNFNGLACKQNAAQKQNDFLKQDTVLFKWFACTYLIQGQSSANAEEVATAMYKALRCGLIHNLTIGKILDNRGADYEITAADRNPKKGGTDWYNVVSVKQKIYTFYLTELVGVVDKLINDLFDKNSSDADVQRFQTDALSVLQGKSPIILVKATKKP